MSANVTGEHSVVVRSGLGLPAVIEAAAMLTDGFVEGEDSLTIGERTFIFACAEAGTDEVVLSARLRHPTSENPVRVAMTPLYNLMAGFFRAGADVTVTGELAAVLPGGGTLAHAPDQPRPSASIRQIFEDHLTPDERTPPVDPAILAEAFHALRDVSDFERRQHDPGFRALFPSLVKDHRGDDTYYLHHRSGLVFVALVNDDAVYAHMLDRHRPLSTRLSFSYADVTPLPARTWGEVWANHAFGGTYKRPGALEILPGELVLIHGITIMRYTVDDRATLADLTDLSFGPGRSRAYPASVWLGIAEQWGENREYQTAYRCAEQAMLLEESAELTDRARQEMERWRGWQTFAAEQAANLDRPTDPPTPVPLQPLSDLLVWLSPVCAARLREVCDEIEYEIAEAHDYRRQVRPLREIGQTGQGGDLFALAYPRVTGQTMLEAGVSPGALTHLRHTFSVIPPPAILDDVFTIRCGDLVIWGTVESQRLLLRDDPSAAYSAKP